MDEPAGALEDTAVGDEAAGALGGGAGSRTVTVSPRPSIPLSSKGWMPYATRNSRGATAYTAAISLTRNAAERAHLIRARAALA